MVPVVRAIAVALLANVFTLFGLALAQETGEAAFSGNVVLEKTGDDPFIPSFRLNHKLVFRQANGKEWVSPPGSVVDGRAVPTIFVQLVGQPLDSSFVKSAVSYEVAVRNKQRTWQAAQRMFYEAVLTEGIEPSEAKAMYLLLSGSGTRWAMRDSKRCFGRCHTDAVELEWRPLVNDEKLESMLTWVRSDDPSLDQIDQRARTAIVDKGPHVFGTPR